MIDYKNIIGSFRVSYNIEEQMVQQKRYNLCLWLRQRSVLYVMVTWAKEQRLPVHYTRRSGCVCLRHGILPNASVKCSYLRDVTSTTIRKLSSLHFARPAARLHFQCVPLAKLPSVPGRAWATVLATPSRCHWSRECGRAFKMAEVVCCDKLGGRRLSAVKTSAFQFNNKTHTHRTTSAYVKAKPG